MTRNARVRGSVGGGDVGGELPLGPDNLDALLDRLGDVREGVRPTHLDPGLGVATVPA